VSATFRHAHYVHSVMNRTHDNKAPLCNWTIVQAPSTAAEHCQDSSEVVLWLRFEVRQGQVIRNEFYLTNSTPQNTKRGRQPPKRHICFDLDSEPHGNEILP
jgi:hypothetical protein